MPRPQFFFPLSSQEVLPGPEGNRPPQGYRVKGSSTFEQLRSQLDSYRPGDKLKFHPSSEGRSAMSAIFHEELTLNKIATRMQVKFINRNLYIEC
jgi:hypothetical protein